MNKTLNNPDYSRAKSVYEFTVENLKGEHVKLNNYEGFVCIFVNIATKSPLTAQNYKHFNQLLDKFGDKGLRILAFPCNQFGLEEPGSPEEITAHAEKNNVKFDIFAKVDVNGETASVVWKFLKHTLAGSGGKFGDMVKSNYTKFIVNKVGIPVERYGPEVEPTKFEEMLNPHFN